MGCTENCNSSTKKLFQQHVTWASGTNTSFLYHPLSDVRLTLGGRRFSEIMVKVWCSECTATGWSWELLANHVTSSRADFHLPYMSSGHQKIQPWDEGEENVSSRTFSGAATRCNLICCYKWTLIYCYMSTVKYKIQRRWCRFCNTLPGGSFRPGARSPLLHVHTKSGCLATLSFCGMEKLSKIYLHNFTAIIICCVSSQDKLSFLAK